MSAIDRAMGRLRIVMLFGPLELPSVSQIRSAFVSIAVDSLGARVGFSRVDDASWVLSSDRIRQRRDDYVRVAPDDCSPLDWLRKNPIADLPVQIAVNGDHLAVSYDHSLVDAMIACAFPRTLLAVANDGAVPASEPVAERPLTVAVAHTFGWRPRAWWAVAKDISQHRRRAALAALHDPLPADIPALTAGPLVPIPETDHVVARFDAEQFHAVLRWARAHRVQPSAALLLLATAVTRAAGTHVEGTGTLIVNLRRYLPEGRGTGANFINGLRVATNGTQFDIGRFSSDVDAALNTGRPLAAAAVQSLRRTCGKHAEHPMGEYRPRSHAHVSMSYVGEIRDFALLPWKGPLRDSILVTTVDSAEPDTIGWTALRVGGDLYLFGAFCGALFDRPSLESAVSQMIVDPVRLLESAAGG